MKRLIAVLYSLLLLGLSSQLTAASTSLPETIPADPENTQSNFKATPASHCLSVATQNLWHDNFEYEKRAQTLRRELEKGPLADIVAFQEAWIWHTGDSLFTDFIAWSGYQPFFRQTISRERFTEGIALASQAAPTRLMAETLPHNTVVGKRVILGARYRIRGITIRVFNVHFMPGPEPLEFIRKDQMQTLLDRTKPFIAKEPVIVLGDFNATPGSKTIAEMKAAGFEDVFGNTSIITYDKANPYNWWSVSKRLDYIFFNKAFLSVKNANLIFKENLISDHYGIRAELCLKRNRPAGARIEAWKPLPMRINAARN
ncbi:MAG: endonuclease/exonuclease/phosphatase family protein [Bdellovibrionota bacterium]